LDCQSVCLFVSPCQLCPEHFSYITLDSDTKSGTNVLLEKAKCCVQDSGPYLKGQGHNHRLKVKIVGHFALGGICLILRPNSCFLSLWMGFSKKIPSFRKVMSRRVGVVVVWRLQVYLFVKLL